MFIKEKVFSNKVKNCLFKFKFLQQKFSLFFPLIKKLCLMSFLHKVIFNSYNLIINMEEVDNIILHTLKQIGCDIPAEMLSLRELSVELVIQASVKCLQAINTLCNIPSILPASMSARFRIGTSIATACQELGYQGDLGYQTFLYANEQEFRKVMLFLIEKLPKETPETVDAPIGRSVLLSNLIAAELKRQLNVPWLPPYCRKNNLVNVGATHWFFQGNSSFHPVNTEKLCYPIGLSIPNGVSKEQEAYYASMKFVTSQPENFQDTYASLVDENSKVFEKDKELENEWHQIDMTTKLSKKDHLKQKKERLLKRIKQSLSAQLSISTSRTINKSGDLKDVLETLPGIETKKVVKGSRFTHAEKLHFTKEEENVSVELISEQKESKADETEEEKQHKRALELQALQDELHKLVLKFQDTQSEIKQMSAQHLQIMDSTLVMEEESKAEEAEYRVKKNTIDLLPDAQNNISKLEQLVENSSQRLIKLNEQWEKHRGPLIQSYRDLKAKYKSRASELETKINQIQILREKIKTVADETRGKEELLKQFSSEFDRMSKDVNRSVYTKRILEIVGNIKKQKLQIANVLIDTRSLQKEINFLSGNLDRTFAVTDELIFKNAKQDEFSRKSYKLLAALHESFASLLKTVEETGIVLREIRDLEEQIDKCNNNEIEENLQKLSNDLSQMKKENDEMITKLKNVE